MSKTITTKCDIEAPPPYEEQPKHVPDMSQEPLLVGAAQVPGVPVAPTPTTWKRGIVDCGGNLGTCKPLNYSLVIS